MSVLDIFSLLEWIYQYLTSFEKFGIKDDSLSNGYLTLVNAYKRKIHLQIYPMITNVLIRERNSEIEVQKRVLYTHSPSDIFKIFLEVFEVLSKQPMKELILGVLEVIHEVFSQYQRALYQMITMDRTLSFEYLVAINNNFGRFFDFAESLLDSCKGNKNLSEEEYNKAFDQRTVQIYFSKISAQLVERITDETWVEVGKYFDGPFLELDLETILNKVFQVFESKIEMMNKQTSREVWKSYLNRTVVSIIQVLFSSFSKIKKKKSEDAVEKIQKDYDKVEEMFSDFMSKRILRPGLEVLGDIKNFFESSVDFLSISVGKMRKDHGPAFNITTVKALLSLRSDMTKQEKNKCLALCKELLDDYKDEGTVKNTGIFNNVDTRSAAQEFNQEMKEKTEGEGEGDQEIITIEDEDEEEMDLGDFLKEGGIDVDELDEKIEETEIDKKKRERKAKKKKIKEKKIVGREDMCGWLYKSNDDLRK